MIVNRQRERERERGTAKEHTHSKRMNGTTSNVHFEMRRQWFNAHKCLMSRCLIVRVHSSFIVVILFLCSCISTVLSFRFVLFLALLVVFFFIHIQVLLQLLLLLLWLCWHSSAGFLFNPYFSSLGRLHFVSAISVIQTFCSCVCVCFHFLSSHCF